MNKRRVCRLVTCNVTVTGTNLFCRPHYYALPKDMRNKLWLPMYGGTDHIRACLAELSQTS